MMKKFGNFVQIKINAMIIEQIYTGCLAQGAYYIQSGDEAAIIDPLREVYPYIEKAEQAGARIKYVLETHFHADFVSGHIDLAEKTGATIVYGPTAAPSFRAYIAKDGEELKLGAVTIRVIHTPGHTMESVCYLLTDENGKETALFSGDTLFIGDVGRPDLAQKAAGMTTEGLAGTLFESLRNKIMPLSDDLIIYPAHGAGSACGKSMSKETTDTLGNQKRYNYALRANMTRDEFIAEVTGGLTTPPAYFPVNVRMNKEGYESIDNVIHNGMAPLSPDSFEVIANESGALLLDTRDAEVFARSFIPNSINIGIDGNFAPWVGALIPDIEQPILLITDKGREEEVVTRLARVGFDHTAGYLEGGIEAWSAAGKETDHIRSVSADELAQELNSGRPLHLLDVRKASEYMAEHVTGAVNLPLDDINSHMADIDKDETYYVHCAGGYRSMIFNSMLRARGYYNLVDVKGGFKAIKQSGNFRLIESACPWS
ncbi:MAG: MBL fold metallo-hydrolase [Mucilaginibacter sp.]